MAVNNNIKLSIIIPTLNEEENLIFLLSSVKAQDFENYEVIVADAGSRDQTVKAAERGNCKITAGGSPAGGRNKGAKAAQGEWLFFLDADTVLPPGFLQRAFDEAERKKLDIVSFFLSPKTNNRFVKFIFYTGYNLPIKVLEQFTPCAAQAILIKRKIHEEIRGFDERIKLAEDHEYVRRAAKIGKFGILSSPAIISSLRRFKQDGWFRTYAKYILCGVYMALKGPVYSDVFNYKFDHYSKEVRKK